ncbi:hypothetical protein [Nonomuraea sp. NPDC049158]|uniref:hypothetical protein n=1 Tax=Nonomuraea sp. NPDC049158 TaxID=3155649 RepID=UPI0033CAAEBF
MSTPDPVVVEHCVSFVRIWAETVLRQVKRVRLMRATFHRDHRNYERLEDWSPTETDLERNFRALWAEEHTLVWAAHQLEKWAQRLARERRQPSPERDATLAGVRNALEHLEDADFDEFHALAGEKSNRSLRGLPGSRIPITLGGELSFGLIDSRELEERALAIVRSIEDEMEQHALARYLAWRDEEEKEARALRRLSGDAVQDE